MSDTAAAVEATGGRYEERAFGFWLYMMSDAIIFGLLFATYAVMLRGTAGGPTGAELFSLPRAFVETMLLLFSSAAFGLATVAARRGDIRGAVVRLMAAWALGAAFLVLEISEFAGMIAVGAGPDRSGFLSAFFVLVGTHGLHVALGLLSLLVIAGQVLTKGLTAPVLSRFLRVGLFWHFLDVIWVGIFSVVYLPGVL
jgi:cytochrome o ubiquinol oxidase subunit 3